MAGGLIILVLVHGLASVVAYGLYRLVTVLMPELAPRIRHDLAFVALLVSALAPLINLVAGRTGGLPGTAALWQAGLVEGVAVVFALAWTALALVFVLRLVVALWTARGLVERARKMEKPATAIWLARALGLKLSNEIETPQLAGLPDPVVLVPEEMEARLGDDAVRGLIEHEYAHLERGDLWFSLVQRVLGALFWWNPLMRLLGREIDLQREMACDDLAVARFGDAHTYASSILDLADRVAVRHTGMAAAAIGSASDLVLRMRRLMDQPGVLAHPALSLGLLVLMLGSGSAVAALTPRAMFEPAAATRQADLHHSDELVLAVGTQSDEVIAVLLAEGADPNSRAEDGQTPLSRAMQTSQTSTLRLLLEAGADPDTEMPGGDRPIHAALRSQIRDNIALLVEHGADLSIPAANGQTPRELALSSANQDLIELIISETNRAD